MRTLEETIKRAKKISSEKDAELFVVYERGLRHDTDYHIACPSDIGTYFDADQVVAHINKGGRES